MVRTVRVRSLQYAQTLFSSVFVCRQGLWSTYKLLLNLTNVAIYSYMGRMYEYIKNCIVTLYSSLYLPVLPKFIKRYLFSHTLYYKSSLQVIITISFKLLLDKKSLLTLSESAYNNWIPDIIKSFICPTECTTRLKFTLKFLH